MPGSRHEPTERHTAIEDRVRRDWGLELPESIFRYDAFLASLGPAEKQALDAMELRPFGIMDVVADADAQPTDDVDVRVHGRYYRDPPEFLTFMHGGSDGLHFGLWFDDGRTCSGVASYYTNDGGDLDMTSSTPLEAIRSRIELGWRDLDDGYHDGDEELPERRARLARLRDALTAFETADRSETGIAYSRRYTFVVPPVVGGRITTLDGGGAPATGETALRRPPQHRTEPDHFATVVFEVLRDAEALEAAVDEARRRCEAGDPAEALVLGRDLHWASGGDAVREGHANELLLAAYRALDRPALAGIALAHHRHRDLRSVQVL